MVFATVKSKAPNFVYLDFNATTPPALFLETKVAEWLSEWGNPSSIHSNGRGPKTLLRDSRRKIAGLVGAEALELIFTSGGSEANNLALKGAFAALLARTSRRQIIISEVEHPSLYKAARSLEKLGARIDMVKVDRGGRIDLEGYKRLLGADTAIVSIMLANNETGNIFPIREMADEAHKVGALFHSDCVQGLGKVAVDVRELGVDLASFSGHKFYALKGTGVLYAKRGTALEPLIHGGGQERSRRGGTENILAIASLGEMAVYKSEIAEQMKRVGDLRDFMEAEILRTIPGVQVTGAVAPRLSSTSSLLLDGVDGESLLMSLDILGFGVSTGAACSSGSPEPSPTLLAMGLSRAEAQTSLRVGLGWSTTSSQIESFVKNLAVVAARLRKIKSSPGPLTSEGERSANL